MAPHTASSRAYLPLAAVLAACIGVALGDANLTSLPLRHSQTHNGIKLQCPPPVSLPMPSACKSSDKEVLCTECVDTLANTTLARLQPYPCDVPDSFLLSCMTTYMPSFLRLGGNANGLGACNKTALAMDIASRTKCVDASGAITTVDYHIPLRAFRTPALVETGGDSLRSNRDEYRA